ncbi:hypothetical protein ADMFC3_19120 [Geovibrio sp. ADMFC3]
MKFFLNVFFIIIFSSGFLYAEIGLNVATIAHSVSTSMKAREIRTQQGWNEVPFKQADVVLVVCRSTLSYPLMSSYKNVNQLSQDADMQLNISGSLYHVYLYKLNDDLSVNEIKHTSFKAND